MNRHERRKQKNNKIKSKLIKNFIKGIKFHTNKEYKQAEVLYNQSS